VNFTRPRRPLVLLALALALAGAAASADAAQTGIPPAPRRWVTDEAGFLSPRTADALDARLEAYQRQTGHQLLVWIGRTIGENQVLEEWAVRTLEAWKVGRKGIDDGLVLFILAEDQKIRVEVGYGLEDKVPDIYAYRVINQVLGPGIRAGRRDEAVDAAVTALIGYISGQDVLPEDEGRPGGSGRGETPLANKIFTGIIVLILLVIFITNPSLAFWLLINILGGGRGGGRGGGWGGGGGGGFSGGGGRSGGGGASGGW